MCSLRSGRLQAAVLGIFVAGAVTVTHAAEPVTLDNLVAPESKSSG